MRWPQIRFTFLEFVLAPEVNGDERNRPVWIDGTGGNFELAEDDYSGQEDDELPEETYGFGFGGKE